MSMEIAPIIFVYVFLESIIPITKVRSYPVLFPNIQFMNNVHALLLRHPVHPSIHMEILAIHFGFKLFIWVLTSLSTDCISYITTGSFMGRENQYIQLLKVLYYKLPTNGNQIPDFQLEVGPGFELQSKSWEARHFGFKMESFPSHKIACGHLFKHWGSL